MRYYILTVHGVSDQGGQSPVSEGLPQGSSCGTQVIQKKLHHIPRVWP